MKPDEIPCRYSDICGLNQWDSEECCILHSSSQDKRQHKDIFTKAFNRLINAGHTNFQKVIFPMGVTIGPRTFTEVLDLTQIEFVPREDITFQQVIFKKGLKIKAKHMNLLTFNLNCLVEDTVTIEINSPMNAWNVHIFKTTFEKDLFIRSEFLINQLRIQNVEFKGNVTIQTKRIESFQLSSALSVRRY